MHLNYIAYYPQYDGYGRWNSRLVRSLQRLGVQVKAATMDHIHMPEWMQRQEGLDWNSLTISCLPPYFLQDVPGRHWLLTMVEGSVVPEEWVKRINASHLERIIVPCQHNQEAFLNSGVQLPVHVVQGGTEPYEFPIFPTLKETIPHYRPYTFLTLADRGFRKGWQEAFYAFYAAFGGKSDGNHNVRLIIKYRPRSGGTPMEYMQKAAGADPRIEFWESDPSDMYSVYAQADCVVLPSRCEGWGMPHREAAMMGLPVITQAYAGLDDGHTHQWSLVVEEGRIAPIPKEHKPSMGEWRIVDKDALAQVMKWCYHSPETARGAGLRAAKWLYEHQTWDHSARKLLDLIEGKEDARYLERTAIPVF